MAFFDSGVGGLTVYSKLRKILPNENYIYFGDTKNMPYGEKTKTELLDFSDQIINFFIEKNAKAVVMACNTTSSVIYNDIKDKYNIPIYPVVQSVAKIISNEKISKLGIFATDLTVKSNAYKNEINKYNPNIEIIQIACPKWVKIVENNEIYKPESKKIIEEKILEMKIFNPDKIVLGCTHYPYLINILSEFMPKEIFIDPSIYFAQFIKNDLKEKHLLSNSNGNEEFYVSAFPENFINNAKIFYEIKQKPNLIENFQ